MSDTAAPTNKAGAAEDDEFSAMQGVYNALKRLDEDAQARVINYVAARLGISVRGGGSASQNSGAESDGVEEAALEEEEKSAPKYASLAELHDAAQPKSNAEKALVAGYWLQVCQGSENFDAQSANKELKHLGEGLANITAAIERLKNRKPALALQLKKSGKSQQARKVYKVTIAGLRAVEEMING